jgi:hypothetical protein
MNSAGFSATYDFEFQKGTAISIENVFQSNIAFDYLGQKVGSGSVGGFRGTHESKNYFIFDLFLLHFSENKGKILNSNKK